MSDRKFFNEEMETLPKSKLKALQLERLQTIVERAYSQNQFYRDLYDEAGVKPSDVKSLEDIRKLPFLEKKTVRAAYPYGMAFKKPNDPGGRCMQPVVQLVKVCLSSRQKKILTTGQISMHANCG